MSRVSAVILVVSLAACRAASPRVAKKSAAAVPGDEPALLAAACLPCHRSPEPPRPDLSAPLDRDTAGLALRAMLEGAMPPPGSSARDGLTSVRKRALADWLCRRSGRNQPACDRLVRAETEPALLRPADIILRRFEGLGPGSLPRADRLRAISPAGSIRTLTSVAAIAGGLLVAVDACGASAPDRRAGCVADRLGDALAPPPGAAAGSPRVSLQDLADLLGVDEAVPAAASVADYRRWVRQQIAGSALYRRLAPVVIQFDGERIIAPLFEATSRESGKTYFYRHRPCAERDLVEVRPWWDPHRPIRICRDDHRPRVVTGTRGQSCDTAFIDLPASSGCGCGPSLIFCGTREVEDRLRAAVAEELELTIAHLVRAGRRFGDLLTTDETVRSGWADFFYARVRFFLSGSFDPPDLTLAASPRPRGWPFRGGLLATPRYLFHDGQRAQVDIIWQAFLCAPQRGRGVDPHALVDAFRDRHDLRADSYMHLAEVSGCRDCHAKLEYAQRAFAGWQSALVGMHYLPDAAHKAPPARFYLKDHLDLRGEGPADLGWLGRTIAEQPEFARCMVSRVTTFLHEGAEIPDELERELVRRFRAGQRMDLLIEDAVVARAFGLAALLVDSNNRGAR